MSRPRLRSALLTQDLAYLHRGRRLFVIGFFLGAMIALLLFHLLFV